MTDNDFKFNIGKIVESEMLKKKARRFVGFLDVLGFKEVVKYSGFDELEKRYDELLKEIYNATNIGMIRFTPEEGRVLEGHRVQKVVGSDSVFIWQRGGGLFDVFHFFKSVCRLVSCSILIGMPLRGGIAFGECIMEEGLVKQGLTGAKVLGQPVVDTQNVEKSIQWIGAALHESVAQEVMSKYEKLLTEGLLLCRHPIPLKDSTPGVGVSDIVLDWTSFYNKDYGDCLARMMAETDKDDVKLKLANTMAFLVRRSIERPQDDHGGSTDTDSEPVGG